jgi:hypothetical protein
LALILLPFGVEWVRLQFFGTKVLFLNDDMAIADYNTRLAMHGQMYVGVYDRFGWHHPGPALYYVFAAFYWVFGSSARTLFATSLLIALVSVAASVLVVQRRAGVAAGRACVLAGGLFLIFLAQSVTSPNSLDIMSILTSPWNPDVVIGPTLLFTVLAASAIDDAPSMAGMLVIGSFLVEADIGTAPLVVIASAAVIGTALGRLVYRRSIRPKRDTQAGQLETAAPATGAWRRPVLSVILGAALLGLIWWPPLLQQGGSPYGNLTAIVDFLAHHRNPLTRNGLLTPFDFLAKVPAGSGVARSAGLATVPFAQAVAALTVVIVLLVATALAAPRRPHYLRFLTVVVAVGLLASAIAGNDIVGPTFGYLLEWTLGVAAALLFAVAGTVGVLLSRHWERLAVPGGRTVLTVGSALGCTAVAIILGVQAATYPNLSSVSYSAIGRAASQTIAALRPGDLPTQINLQAKSLSAIDMYAGFVDTLSRRGVDLVIEPIWFNSFGNGWFGLHGRLQTGPSRSVTIVSISSPAGPPSAVRRHTVISVRVVATPRRKLAHRSVPDKALSQLVEAICAPWKVGFGLLSATHSYRSFGRGSMLAMSPKGPTDRDTGGTRGRRAHPLAEVVETSGLVSSLT